MPQEPGAEPKASTKFQTRSLEAIRNAKEQEVKLQRNIALYNQAVGVQP